MVYTRFKRRTEKVHIFEFDTNGLISYGCLINLGIKFYRSKKRTDGLDCNFAWDEQNRM